MEERIGYRKVLKNRRFFLLCIGQATSCFGDSLTTIALIGLIAWFTGGAKEINMMWLMLSCIAPQVLLGPFAGVFVDRLKRKNIMILSDLIRGFLILLIPFTQSTYQIFIIAFLVSIADIFFSPAYSAFIPNIVEKKELFVANSILTSTREFMNLIGPAIGGVIIGLFGIKSIFFIDAVTFFLSALAIWNIPAEEALESKRLPQRFFSELKDGLIYIRRNRVISFICLLFCAMMLAGGTINLVLPLFVNEVLQKGVKEFGFLMSANALGIILGSLIGGRIGQGIDKVKLIIFAVILCGVNSTLFVLNPVFVVGLGLFVINGFANGLWGICSGTVIQEEVEDSKRGRVFSVVGAVSGSSNMIASGMAGILARIFGSKVLFLASGIFMSIIGIISSFFPIREEKKVL
ncbi:MAG: MFS transporter [bacterium]|nr:MFS transporter [bacterium]